MSLSGLITEIIFDFLNLIPTMDHNMSHTNQIGWNYTTVLNILALALIVWIYWMYRTQVTDAVDQEFAKDLVCGMQVRISDAPAQFELNGKTYYFCMPGCRDTFQANPERFAPATHS
jgi:YHS domain-containing protein